MKAVLLTLGIVSVSLSGSHREMFSQRTNSATTIPVAAADNKPALATAARAERAATHSLVEPLDLERLTSNADLIVIGRVNSISNQGRSVATLSLDKVVKGEANAGTIEFEFLTNVPSAYVRIQPQLFGMFFLKQKVDGSYQILDPVYPAVIALAHAVVTGEPRVDRTVNVVGQVLLTAKADEDRQVAVRVLSSARTERATELLRQSAKDKDVVVRMQSISALLNRDDIETLESAERTLLNPPAGTEPYLLENMSGALEGIKDPRAIPALQRLLQSSSTRTRQGAVSALRQMRTMEAVEGLVIALGDNNREVRYEAVIGLAELTGENEWAPATDTFASDEQKYLDHWKEWSRNR